MTDDVLKQLLDDAMNLCMVMDRAGVIIYANKALERLLGVEGAPIQGQRLISMVHQNDAAALNQAFEQAFKAPGARFKRTFRLGRKQRPSRIFEATYWVTEGQDGAPRLLVSAQDATHRVKAQQKLRDQEDQLNRAQRIAKIGSWEWNLTTDVITASQQLFHLYGLEPTANMTFQDFTKYFHPEDLERINEIVYEAQQNMAPFEVNYRIIRNDGVERRMVTHGEVELYGKNLMMYGTSMDVTEKHAMEASLRKSERQFRAIFNSTFQFIGLLNPEGILLEANDTALQFGGITREDIVNKPFWECYWWTVSSEGQEKLRKAIKKAALGAFVRYNAEVYGAGEKLYTIDFSLKPVFDVEGNVMLLIPEGRDITEQIEAETALRASEAKYRILVESMSEGVAMVDEEGRIKSLNKSALQILKVSSDELINRSLDESVLTPIHPDGTEIKPEEFILARALKTGKPHSTDVMGLPQKDGSTIWISVNAVPISGGFPGSPFAAVATFRDITEIVQREAALKESREQLRQLASQLNRAQEAERSRLAREVHDVLGQATTALRLDIHWLKENGPQDDELFQDRAKKTLDEIEETIGIVRRISHELRPGVLDHFGLGAALEWLAEQYQERSALKFEVQNDVEAHLDDLDPDLATALFRIFQEAITNIVKHAEAQKVKVKLGREEDHLILSVSDDGIGLNKKNIKTSASLGLLNMQERVLPWHGEVSVTGKPGKGTQVLVKVPLPA